MPLSPLKILSKHMDVYLCRLSPVIVIGLSCMNNIYFTMTQNDPPMLLSSSCFLP